MKTCRGMFRLPGKGRGFIGFLDRAGAAIGDAASRIPPALRELDRGRGLDAILFLAITLAFFAYLIRAYRRERGELRMAREHPVMFFTTPAALFAVFVTFTGCGLYNGNGNGNPPWWNGGAGLPPGITKTTPGVKDTPTTASAPGIQTTASRCAGCSTCTRTTLGARST